MDFSLLEIRFFEITKFAIFLWRRGRREEWAGNGRERKGRETEEWGSWWRERGEGERKEWGEGRTCDAEIFDVNKFAMSCKPIWLNPCPTWILKIPNFNGKASETSPNWGAWAGGALGPRGQAPACGSKKVCHNILCNKIHNRCNESDYENEVYHKPTILMKNGVRFLGPQEGPKTGAFRGVRKMVNFDDFLRL